MAKIEVNEIFTSIQGEGKYTGYPSTFIRLTGCNLRCVFAGGSICDSAYTSHHPEPSKFKTVEEVINEVKKQQQGLNIPHIVITGGEPMRQQPGLVELIHQLRVYNNNVVITIETNGTYVNKNLGDIDPDLFSISPKLSTSAYFEEAMRNGERYIIPESQQKRHHRDRINYEAIVSYINSGGNFQFKFVYSKPENEMEIKNWINGLIEYNNTLESYWRIPHLEEKLKTRVLIMPEGELVKEISDKAEEVVEVCMRNGWIMTDRLHIRIWGDKRAV